VKRTLRQIKRQSGFTMLEIIAVLVIIGIISAVAIVRMQSTRDYDVISRVEVVKTHLRLAQSRAMNSSRVWGINYSGTSNYSMFRNGSVTDVVRLPNQNADNVTLPDGMTITTGIVSFNAWGQPYTDAAGTAAQTATRTITLTNKSGDARSISITKNTGFIP
jgi:prepilin-type N-terminal cleavage/methylation domain-containing protein